MSADEPDNAAREERIRRITAARVVYDDATAVYADARAALLEQIREALAEGIGPNALARHSGFSREYVARIRDGKVSDNPVSKPR